MAGTSLAWRPDAAIHSMKQRVPCPLTALVAASYCLAPMSTGPGMSVTRTIFLSFTS